MHLGTTITLHEPTKMSLYHVNPDVQVDDSNILVSESPDKSLVTRTHCPHRLP